MTTGLRLSLLRLVMLVALAGIATIHAYGQTDELNPPNPPEPEATYRVDVVCSDADAGYVSGRGKYKYGTSVYVNASAATGYKFQFWMKMSDSAGIEYIFDRSFYYSVAAENVRFEAFFEFDPDSPAEPSPVYRNRLYVSCIPADACSFNISSGNRYDAGTSVYLRAYANQGFRFLGWFDESGEKVSDYGSFYYIMPRDDQHLTARYEFDPDSPAEPTGSQTDVDNSETDEPLQQTISIAAGWNWISTFIGEPVAVDALFDKGAQRVLSQTHESVNDPKYGVVGGVACLQPGVGYKVYSAADFTISCIGKPVDAATRFVALRKGWNWIGYPCHKAKDIASAIANAEEGDYVVSQGGFAVFADGAWRGTLNELEPGHGYLYKSASDKTLQFGDTE